MSKYIDAEKLIAEIERRIQFCEDFEREGEPDTTSSEATLKSLRLFITSLQQEQPECIYGRTLEERKKCCKFCSAICEARIEQDQPEVDLEEEIKRYQQEDCDRDTTIRDVARYFAEWGATHLNARKEDKR